MKKGLVLVVMCVAMLFAAASSASAQAPSDEYKATLEKMLELSAFRRSGKESLAVSWRNFTLLFIRNI